MEAENKFFDSWDVDCNSCQEYFNNTCDGAKIGKTVKCKSYYATRQVDLPKRIDENKAEIKKLNKQLAIAYAIIGLNALSDIILIVRDLLC